MSIEKIKMSKIKTFEFDRKKLESIKKYEYGLNWPVVYIIENGKDAYVGESTSVSTRAKQHFDNAERANLKKIHIITDDEYNVSATLDIESWLIQYMAADETFMLQNGNGGLKNHKYYDKERYEAKFEIIWKELMSMSLVKKELNQIRNSDLFKYSPYKALTEDQIIVAENIFNEVKNKEQKTFLINGKPGTGKTILAIYLIKFLKSKEETKDLKIGLVVPMTSLRKTIKKVFTKVKGLKSSMVIGSNDVTKEVYDILIVDEAHRLKQRKNITGYKNFDITNKKLGYGNEGTELDWILKSSRQQILFYDENQSIRPSDVRAHKFKELNTVKYDLISQQRIEAGEEYINFIDDLFELKSVDKYEFVNYDLKIYKDIHKMVGDIKNKDSKYGLCRVVAGYAWPWNSKKSKNVHDIEIEGLKLFWNSTNQDWVNSKNAINEVGCIHTIQGYDLNYVGVIIGPELSYDEEKNKLVVKKESYMDTNGWAGVGDPEELSLYIKNIYKTLLTRGIKGTYIYIVDKKLAEYFNKNIKVNKHEFF